MVWYIVVLFLILIVISTLLTLYFLYKKPQTSELESLRVPLHLQQSTFDELELPTQPQISNEDYAVELNHILNELQPEQETESNYERLLNILIKNVSDIPIDSDWETKSGQGSGIVICISDISQYTSAFLSLCNIYYNLNSEIETEVWTNYSISNEMIQGLENISKKHIKVRDLKSYCTTPNLNEANKSNAIIHSKFRKVLLLDADSYILTDPTDLISNLLSSETQPLFLWSHYYLMNNKSPCWMKLPSDNHRDFLIQNFKFTISGSHLLIDKLYTKNLLNLTNRINTQLNKNTTKLFQSEPDVWLFSALYTSTPICYNSKRAGNVGFRDETGKFYGTTLVLYDFQMKPIVLYKAYNKWINQQIYPEWIEYQYFYYNTKGHVDTETKDFTHGIVCRTHFKEEFNNIEDKLWDYLTDLRSQPWYQLTKH
jgi:hypothetical protein